VSHSGQVGVAKILIPCVLAVLLITTAGIASTLEGLDDLAGPLKALALNDAGRQIHNAVGIAPGTVVPSASGQAVQVVVYFRSAGDAMTTDLGRYGAAVQIRRGRRVQALLPVGRLLDVAKLPQVAQIAPPSFLIPAQGYGATCSEGAQLTNALMLHALGITGQGCKIAVVDLGFAEYDTHEVPPPAAVVSFRADASTTASYHGTAMAEVVADMAPDAELYLVAVDTGMSAEQAVDWIISQGINVAVMSLTLVEGPFDGTHPLSQAVDNAQQAGVLWINAAGNYAQRHWMGDFSDTDSDNIHEWSPGNEDMQLTLPDGRFDAYLSWFETAGDFTSQDYDLVLYDGATKVAQSAYTQDGDDPPQEHLAAYVSAGVYTLRIEAINIDPGQVDHFQLFLPDVDVPPALQVPEGSVAVPGDAQGCYTVGATTLSDAIEPYSSQGPVQGGWPKVDLVAPDGVTTSLDPTTGLNPFVGTSVAAAHVAGGAALLWSEDNNRTAEDIARGLKNMAVDLGPVGPDPVYGSGRLNLRAGVDTTKPTILITYPQTGRSITIRQPRITAIITDNSGEIDPDSLVLTLDGTSYYLTDPALDYDPATGLMEFETPSPLAYTTHQVVIDVSDLSNNPADTAICDFRVVPLLMDAGLHMFALPYTSLTDPNPVGIFGLPPSQFALVRWVATDSSYLKYHFYPDPLASFQPPDAGPGGVVPTPPAGLGYFVNVPVDVTLNVGGTLVPSDTYYRINLYYGVAPPRGWNMIGTPFIVPVDWGGAKFITDGRRQSLRDAVNDGVTDGILFELKTRNGTPYYDFAADPFSAQMEPYKGYWIHVWQDTTLELYGSTSLMEAKKSTGTSSTISADNWQLQLVVSAGDMLDPTNIIGVAANASDGYDAGQDVLEPPAVVDGLQVYIPHRQWGEKAGFYARDIRGAGADVQTWDIEVVCSLSQTPVTLQWPDVNAKVPAEVTLLLKDLDSGKEVYMRTATEYTFTSPEGGGVRHLQIVASVGGAKTLSLNSVTAAQAPGGGIAFSYQVTRPAAVTVEVRNISGVLIKRFSEQPAEANVMQTVLWNGISDRGTKAPAGRYLACITARSDNGQAVQAIRPFVVQP